MFKNLTTRRRLLVVICSGSFLLLTALASAQDVGEELFTGIVGGEPSEMQIEAAPSEDTAIEAVDACAICDPGCIQSSNTLCLDEVKETGVYIASSAPSVTVEVCSTDPEVIKFANTAEGPFQGSINVVIPAGGSSPFYVKGLKGGSATEVIKWPTGWVCITSPARVSCCCVPWTVAEPVEFQGITNCGSADSGFDNTSATTNPPWLSVARGGSTKVAKAVIPSSTNPKDVTFSPEPTTTGQVTVSPTNAKKSTQILTVKGVAPGEAAIRAKVRSASCSKLNVAVYEKRIVKVAAHIITAAGCSAPNPNTSKGKLQKGLNAIWDQSSIEFNVTVDKKQVAYDTDGDCVLDQIIFGPPVTLGPEISAILAAVKDPYADINVYYVKDLQPGQAGLNFGTDCFIEQIDFGSTEIFTAHEIGHALGLLDCSKVSHCDDGPTSNNLMVDVRTLSNPNPCFLNKVQWDKANQKAGTLMQSLASFIESPIITDDIQERDQAIIEDLFIELQDGDFEQDSLEEFLSMGDKTIPVLLRQFENDEPLVRQIALDLLGRIDLQDDRIINKKEVVYAMQSAIDGWEDSQIEVDTALRYLMKIDSTTVTPIMIEALFLKLEAGWPRAALVLGQIGDSALKPALEPFLESVDDAVFEMTELALAKIGDQRYRNDILTQLDAKDENLRLAAFQKLAYIGDKAFVPKIAESLYDSTDLKSSTSNSAYIPYRFLAAAVLATLVENPPVKVEFPELYTDEDIALWLYWWETNQSQYR